MGNRGPRKDQPWNPPPGSADVSTLFVLFVGVPLLLPLLGIELGDIAFAIPFAVLVFAAVACGAAARRTVARARAWTILAVAAGLAATASLIAVVTSVAGFEPTAGLYFGALASAAILVAVAPLARRSLAGVKLEPLVDAILLGIVVAAVGIYFVAVPGFAHGDVALTAVFLIDLAALLLTVLATIARRERRHRRIGWGLAGMCAGAALGDGIVSASAAGGIPALPTATALLWTAAGASLALAADFEIPAPAEPLRTASDDEGAATAWVLARVVLPVATVLSLPAIAVALAVANELTAWAGVYFGTFFVAALVLAFGRQAWLLVENRRVVNRERRAREVAVRRNEELEALTGLATTMTETLEEAPIMERGLSVLHLAARATSSALHVGDASLELRAAAGDWQKECPWADRTPALDGSRAIETRGGRHIVRVPLRPHGRQLGVVTIIRPAKDALDEEELDLLNLLVDQLGIALQNARDYRERLEQAIRDPLIGIYNRRFFYEALEKEMNRGERYGSAASLALFDVDDFKDINDSIGHAAGDQVLRRIGEIVNGVIRHADIFARVGGEEFGLLMPETTQLDALLVAERVRTAIARSDMLESRRVTISGGVASCPQDATVREELERKADAALYWAKRSGKNICAVASEVVVSEGDEQEGMLAHLYAMVAAIDAQHLLTRDHSENVGAYAVAIGQELGLDRERIVRLRRAALLHDIGKIAVSREILVKPAALDDGEFAEMKRHAPVGGAMLLHAGLCDEGRWVRHHHERIDGRGYPDGLAGESIPLEARIIFVADAFEAMTSDRPYREGAEVEVALAELRRNAGTQFDPRVVDALVSLVEDGDLTVQALRRGTAWAQRLGVP
jgi:diguanylate cyclase (GGDEF)-like protein